MNSEFRELASARLQEEAGAVGGFDFFSTHALATREFEIVYAIVANWHGRAMSTALPFFSKINLREVTTNLRSRDFRVGTKKVSTN
jgi:uncharacterized protein (TIGR04141 family)